MMYLWHGEARQRAVGNGMDGQALIGVALCGEMWRGRNGKVWGS